MHRRSRWQPSGDSPRSIAVQACVSSTCLGSDTHPCSHQGGEPPRGLRLEAQEGEELQAPTQRCPEQPPEPAITAQSAPAATIRPAAPTPDMPLTTVRRLPPSQRPPRAARVGPPHWAIPLATSRHPAKKKKIPAVTPPFGAPGGQRRMRARTEPLRDLVTLSVGSG